MTTTKIRTVLSGMLLLGCFSIVAQNDAKSESASVYAKTITITDLRDNLAILSSDALEGRETGERGQKMAAAFIANDFENLGLQRPIREGESDSYYQRFDLYMTGLARGYIKIGDRVFKNNKDFFYQGKSINTEELTVEVFFLGDGKSSDMVKENIAGNSILIVGDIESLSMASQTADSLKAKYIFNVLGKTQNEFNSKKFQRLKDYFSNKQMSFQDTREASDGVTSIFISPEMSEALMGKSIVDLNQIIAKNKKVSKVKPKTLLYKINQEFGIVKTENILGVVEGTDLKDEVIVISCHYDHVGITDGQVNNGADDDGSGVTALLELAEAFSQAKKEGNGPRRSIVFIAFTAEEKGLLGSAYYTDNPIYKLENTIVNLNIDMIGRIDEKHRGNNSYTYLVGSDKLSSELHDLSEDINKTHTQLELDYTYNEKGHPDRIYYRSDHWNFAKNNVPIIFYNGGFTEDYHKPTDTIDKIEFVALQRRTKLVFYTAWELANRDEKPKLDKAP